MRIKPVRPGIIGYCDPWSARPGKSLSFKISSAGGLSFTSRVVRVRHADPNPAGPGMKLILVPDIPNQVHAGLDQQSAPGSFGRAACPAVPDDFHIVLNLRVLKHFENLQCVVALSDEEGRNVLALSIENGMLVLSFACSEGPVSVETDIRLEILRWWSLGLEIDLPTGTARLELVELPPRAAPLRRAAHVIPLPAIRPELRALTTVTFGAIPGPGSRCAFDGQLEAPAIGPGAMPDLVAIGGALGVDAGSSLAAWDFAAEMSGFGFADRGPGALHGTLVNLPTRAMKGSNWSGREMSWRHCPGEYGGVHFHADDVGDLDWTESLRLEIPDTLPSGVYALQVENAAGLDRIPFYVLPHLKRRGPARIAFLASTMTYLAYANHARDNWTEAFQARARSWGAAPNNPDVVRDLGFSTYNYHPDGSGVALSSRRRPVLTMRPGYLTFDDPHGSGLRHFPADSHLTDWLEEKGFAFDVITDEDLDDHGVDLIGDYPLLMTGSHPEYHTEAMLDALEQYRARGGNVCYMGGNGFYWRIARPKAFPWLLEIRRAESGIRAWASEPGEYYNQLDGAYGGLWRRNGRPPQMLAEIGFAVQGLFEGSFYRRTPESADPAVSWIFDGVEGDILGNFGLSGGGAAGFELDQVSQHFGTANNTVVIARSEAHGPSFLGVPEDILTHTIAVGGRVEIEAHMVYGRNEAGGEVFSTGSITFLGSLSHNGYDNPISRIVENVVRRFSAGPSPHF